MFPLPLLVPPLLHVFTLLLLLLLFQFHPFLQSAQFYNSSMDGMYLDENGELTADLNVINSMLFPNKSIRRKKFGRLKREGSLDLKLFINQDDTALLHSLNKVGEKISLTLITLLT